MHIVAKILETQTTAGTMKADRAVMHGRCGIVGLYCSHCFYESVVWWHSVLLILPNALKCGASELEGIRRRVAAYIIISVVLVHVQSSASLAVPGDVNFRY